MIAIVGWIGSVLCVSSLIQKNQMRFRALNLGACIAMITFNTANATWSMVLLNVVVAVINIRQIRLLCRATDEAATDHEHGEAASVAGSSAMVPKSELVLC